GINVSVWAWLLLLSAWRLAAWPHDMLRDFRNPARGPGFMTLSAGTLVLASQCVTVVELPAIAAALTAVGAVSWLLLLYLFLAAAMMAASKPSFVKSINGGWLIMVVATQAVSASISQLGSGSPLLHFSAVSLFMLGAMLYVIIITLLFYRMVFRRLQAHDLTPPYWINMGALAITTLAGSLLVLHTGDSNTLSDLLPFLKGFTTFFWATATWWIPLLLILGYWRHVHCGIPLRYETSYWNIVFPVSMYAVGTFYLAAALDETFLRAIPAVGVYVGFAVWLIVAVAGLHRGLTCARTA